MFRRAIGQLPTTPLIRGFVVGRPVYDTRGSQYSRPELQAAARSMPDSLAAMYERITGVEPRETGGSGVGAHCA